MVILDDRVSQSRSGCECTVIEYYHTKLFLERFPILGEVGVLRLACSCLIHSHILLLSQSFVNTNFIHCSVQILPIKDAKAILIHHAKNLGLVVIVFEII